MEMHFLRASDLIIQRGRFRFGPLNFEVKSSGVLNLVGKNGSGKTSLLRALNQRLPVFSGEVQYSAMLRRCSIGSEEIFFSNWSVAENFRWLQKLGRLKPAKENLIQHIQHFMQQKVYELSAGKKRQAELVFALSHDFDIYFLDEVFSHLDPEQRLFFQDQLVQLSKDGKISVLSGHDPSEFNFYPDKRILEL